MASCINEGHNSSASEINGLDVVELVNMRVYKRIKMKWWFIKMRAQYEIMHEDRFSQVLFIESLHAYHNLWLKDII